VSRDLLRDIAGQYHNWVKNRSVTWDAPLLDAPYTSKNVRRPTIAANHCGCVSHQLEHVRLSQGAGPPS
jgi:hypothetical protein